MNEIKKRIVDYLKSHVNADDYDIEHFHLHDFMDSLDIAEMVLAIENQYHIDVTNDCDNWENFTVEDVVKYIKNKLDEKHGE